ncbi:MAG: tetratricopeptide repeat protein, partial [Candidatus Obscuribacterales bacterium]|nr:tetratricopeptide repeat protein [Candidatus Obscuribacterales bacterium]
MNLPILKITKVLLVALLFSLNSACQAASEPGQKKPQEAEYDKTLLNLFRIGMTHTDLRSVGDLIIKVRRQVTNNPDNPLPRMKMGSYLYLTGDYEGAAMEMKRAVALDPDNYVAHTLLARLLDEAGDQSAAQIEYERAIKLNPEFPDARVFYAESLMKRGGVSEALDEFRLANESKPTTYGLSGLAEALVVAD